MTCRPNEKQKAKYEIVRHVRYSNAWSAGHGPKLDWKPFTPVEVKSAYSELEPKVRGADRVHFCSTLALVIPGTSTSMQLAAYGSDRKYRACKDLIIYALLTALSTSSMRFDKYHNKASLRSPRCASIRGRYYGPECRSGVHFGGEPPRYCLAALSHLVRCACC